MALQLIEIADIAVASPQSSIDFTSIPSGYTDLIIKVSYRATDASNAGVLVSTFNNDGGNNYVNRYLFGTGSGVGSGNYNPNNSNYHGYGNISTTTVNTFTSADIYIPNYTSSNYKSSSTDIVSENNATAAYQHLAGNIWNSTAAINRITLGIYTQIFATGSTATLYGVL